MILKMTSVLASCKRRIQARCKDLEIVTVKFIRRGPEGRKERYFLFPTQEIGAKTQNGDPWLLVLY
jgi:hypothetical protein